MGKLSSLAVQFARELEARGIGCGERVFLWGPNTGEWLAVFIGCLLRGAIVVPMDAIAAPEFARRVIAEAAPRLAVISREMAPLVGIDSIALGGFRRDCKRAIRRLLTTQADCSAAMRSKLFLLRGLPLSRAAWCLHTETCSRISSRSNAKFCATGSMSDFFIR